MTAPTRRRFLSDVARLAGGSWLALSAPGVVAAAAAAAKQRAEGEGWVNLSPAEALTVTALVDRIIPADDLPGASEMGAVYFIDQALGGFYAEQAEAFRAGLRDLDARSGSVVAEATPFADLQADDQDALLRTVESSPFFSHAIFLTHCGLFALPAWGGNRDRMGWDLVGFDSRHSWQPPFGYYDAQVDQEARDNAG